MSLSLDRTLLAAQPLIVTLAQVRFEQHPEVAEPGVAAALQAPMAGLGLPVAAQVNQQQFLVAGNAPGPEAFSQQTAAGWQFKSPDGSTAVTVMADQATLETRQYAGWEVFNRAWEQVLQSVQDAVSPQLVTRLGLRYVNRVRPLKVRTAAGWRDQDLVDHAFLGPAAGSKLSGFITAAEGRATMSFPDGVDALVHHGVLTEDESQVFVLDIDCFRQQAETFTLEGVLSRMQDLNDRSLEVFQSVISERLRSEMLGGGE